jgi:hypothetical protein
MKEGIEQSDAVDQLERFDVDLKEKYLCPTYAHGSTKLTSSVN